MMPRPIGLFSHFFLPSAAEETTSDKKAPAKKGGLLSNGISSAIGGLVHASLEQPIATPIEASITQMQINGKGFFWNFNELRSRGVWNGLYRAFPTAMVGAAPKACIHYSFLNYWINFYTVDGDIRSATKKQSAMIGASCGASEANSRRAPPEASRPPSPKAHCCIAVPLLLGTPGLQLRSTAFP
jgi:hypothetical protein